MKRVLLTVLLAFCGIVSNASEKEWQELLAIISGHRMESSFSYEIVDGKKNSKGKGSIKYQAGAFDIVCGPFRLCNDGQSLWTINELDKEVVADKGLPGELFAEPELILQLLGVNPSRASYSLKLDTGKLSSLVVKTNDGASIVLEFRNFKLLPESALTDFQMDGKSFDSSYVVTDLR